MVKRQIKGSNLDENFWIRYPQKSWLNNKSIETKFVQIGLKIKEKSLFRNQQNHDKIWAKMKKFQFLNSNYLSKSNLNYLESEDYKGVTLLARLTWRFSLKLLWLLLISSIPSIPSLMWFWHSRGDYQTFSHNVHDLLTSIYARLSLERKRIMKYSRSSLKMLNFTLIEELHFRKREHQFIEEIPDLNRGHLFRLKSLDSSDEATSRAGSGPESPRRSLHFLLDFCRSIFMGVATIATCHTVFS